MEYIIIVAFAIGLLYLFRIRSMDFYEKEPVFKLLLAFFLGGIFSIIISTIIYAFIDVQYNMLDAIFKIGLIEESSKLLSLMIIYRIIKKDFNEIVDGLVYIIAISLGFAVIENIFYALNSASPFLLLFQRSVYAVLGHISFSGYMGIAFFIHVRCHKNWSGIFLSLFLSALAHGLYDGFLFDQELISFFNLIFLIIVLAQFYFYKFILGYSRFRVNLTDDVFKVTGETKKEYCAHCNAVNDAQISKFWKIESTRCNQCHSFNINSKNFKKFFSYFRPLKRMKKFLRKQSKKDKMFRVEQLNYIIFNTKEKAFSAEISELQNWLDTNNEADKQKIIKIPILGNLLSAIGLKHL